MISKLKLKENMSNSDKQDIATLQTLVTELHVRLRYYIANNVIDVDNHDNPADYVLDMYSHNDGEWHYLRSMFDQDQIDTRFRNFLHSVEADNILADFGWTTTKELAEALSEYD